MKGCAAIPNDQGTLAIIVLLYQGHLLLNKTHVKITVS